MAVFGSVRCRLPANPKVWGQGRVGPGEFALIGRAPDAGGAKLAGGVIALAPPVGILKIDRGNFGLPLPVRIS